MARRREAWGGAVAVGLVIALACGPTGRAPPVERLMEGMSGQDTAIEQACELTARRCTTCHDLDRVLAFRPADPVTWELYVGRMRRMRGSGISHREGDTILRCLVYRSFGADGLRDLEPSAGSDR